MLTRALFALALFCSTTGTGFAEETKVLALGLTDHAVTQEELEKGEALAAPRFNTGAVAYAWLSNLKKGDTVLLHLMQDEASLMHNTETLGEDQANFLLLAGKTGVPAGGWPEGQYRATVKVTRDGETIVDQGSEPTAFD